MAEKYLKKLEAYSQLPVDIRDSVVKLKATAKRLGHLIADNKATKKDYMMLRRIISLIH